MLIAKCFFFFNPLYFSEFSVILEKIKFKLTLIGGFYQHIQTLTTYSITLVFVASLEESPVQHMIN